MSLTLTILVDDVSGRADVLAEHGFAVHIQTDHDAVLMDTGQSGSTLRGNAEALGVDLCAAAALVLSHGHYDHTGGMPAFLEVNSRARLFLHPVALSPRFRRLAKPPHKAIGIADAKAVVRESHKGRVTWTTGPTWIAPEVFVTGPIPRKRDFEAGSADLCFDPSCLMPDAIPDDQALWVRTSEGPVVVVGCAHAGIVNTLDYVRDLSGSPKIRAVIGGLHLATAGEDRLARTCAALRDEDTLIVSPCHCTGTAAMERLAGCLGDRYRACSAGERLVLA